MKRVLLLAMAAVLFISVNAAKTEEPKAPAAPTVKVETETQNKEMSKSTKDSIMYSKLSADQLLEMKRMEIEAGQPPKFPFSGLVAFMLCSLPFLFAGTVIIINVRAKKEESKRKYDLYTKSLEMGQTIPEHFFDEPQKKANPASNLKRGVIWLAVGLAIILSFILMNKHDGLILGIVPAFVGAGYLIVHFLDKPKSDTSAQ